MNGSFDIWFGGIFAFIGYPLLILFFLSHSTDNLVLFFVGLSFAIIGTILLKKGLKTRQSAKKAALLGVHYQAIVWAYEPNYSVQINDMPTIELVLRFIDDQGRLRQELFPTNSNNTSKFPIGGCIEIAEYEDESFLLTNKAIIIGFLPDRKKIMDPKAIPYSKTGAPGATSFTAAGTQYGISKKNDIPIINKASATGRFIASLNNYSLPLKILQSLPIRLGSAKKITCPNCGLISVIEPETTIICSCGQKFKLTKDYKII